MHDKDMKKLYLMRHAHAEPEAASPLGDHERVLSADGCAQALRVADFMRGQGFIPDFILSSSSARTFQTAHIIFGRLFQQEGQKVESRFDRAFYLAEAETVLKAIQATPDKVAQLLVIGHNPGIGELAGRFAPDAAIDGFSPGKLVVYSSSARNWHELALASIKMEKSFVP